MTGSLLEQLEQSEGIRKKVLIVDDEFIERAMLGAMLDGVYDVAFAENGEIALEQLKVQDSAFSLVLLDLHMPVMDGYTLLRMIRADSALRRIPVIVLTAEKGSEIECLKMGAADFITKPYDAPEVIKARVARSIELAEDSVIIHETEKDPLTGLFNREFFFEYGKILDRKSRIPMDAVVLDVNRFHIINELYGRAHGDEVLKELADVIAAFVQDANGLACRSDGNCFYMYLPHGQDLEQKLGLCAGQIDRAVGDQKLSVRIGVYVDDGSRLDMERKFDRARLAFGKLRENYGTSIGFYNAEMHNKELYAERLIADMDRAISEKEFLVCYQPKYDIRGETPVLAGAEALLRWRHPVFGLLRPGLFVPLFENNGMIYKLDQYVWTAVAAQVKSWRENFGATFPVSVNVSRVDLFNPRLIEDLCAIVSSAGISESDLFLEITESAYTDDAGRIVETLQALRKAGFRIEMDDFGSGYSSLNMLTAMPLDALKLDMSFIKHICEDKKAARLVGIMIELARLLDVPVIAEGVETEGQLSALRQMGCDLIQGYYFSRPLLPGDFEKLLR